MKILIIEDEEQAYKRLQKLIKEVIPSAHIAGIVVSVQSAVAWFNKNPMPELIFMDINLADGSSFEIFKSVNISCPIIFTTAYGEYAVQAFKVNSIDYLLKPVDRNDIEKAIDAAWEAFPGWSKTGAAQRSRQDPEAGHAQALHVGHDRGVAARGRVSAAAWSGRRGVV